MAAAFLQAKDWVTSKVTPDCVKASADELKTFAKNKTGGQKESTDPSDPANKHKITEWQAGWNVTNAIQVPAHDSKYTSVCILLIYYTMYRVCLLWLCRMA
jgi:hypothetical protein